MARSGGVLPGWLDRGRRGTNLLPGGGDRSTGTLGSQVVRLLDARYRVQPVITAYESGLVSAPG